ncbi:hypothetical protein ABZS63_26865, partial [Streptomyces sp. NPDC005568]
CQNILTIEIDGLPEPSAATPTTALRAVRGAGPAEPPASEVAPQPVREQRPLVEAREKPDGSGAISGQD